MRKKILIFVIATFSSVGLSADEPELSRFNMMIDKAEIIFRGAVVAKEFETTNDLQVTYTLFTFDIHEEFKGKSPDGTLIVRVLGGVSESGHPVMYSHYPSFSLGGEYLVFLKGNGEYGNPVLGGYWFNLGPTSGEPVFLDGEGWQVLNIDENGPVFGDGPIIKRDQPGSDMGYLVVDTNDPELGGDMKFADEIAVDIETLYEKLRQHISKRKTESSFKLGKKVDHATAID
ncbi:MAG: hypothetical protein IH907_03530 [Proteobacteria bacterium]|nr:hypothetical protein [Pseudomonadota bacterium]